MPLFDDRRNNQTSVSMYADGAPPTPQPHMPWAGEPDAAPEEGSTVARVVKSASRIRQFEGWRGYSNRTLGAVRQLGAVLFLVACYLLAHWCFSDRYTLRFGGEMLIFSVAFIQVIAAIGTIIYAESRYQIIDQARHFTFGIVALPGAAVAVFMKIIDSSIGVSGGDDIFTGMLLGNGLPLVYFSVVVIPAFVFAKYIFGGLRSVNRKALADEETIAAMMRHDKLQH